MRQLHLVGFTSERDGLILAARRGAKTGGFLVKLDDGFLESLDQARRSRQAGLVAPAFDAEPPTRPRIQSALTPREMQARLRTGRTVAQVAAEAGVDVDWVERFAAPVVAEQAAAVARAHQAVLRTPRRGVSGRPLGPSVVRNLADRGIRLAEDEFASSWSSFQLTDGEWIVRFKYHSRGRDQQAEWLLDFRSGVLAARNRLATDLGYVDPVHPVAIPDGRPNKRPAKSASTTTKAKKAPADGAAPPPDGRSTRRAVPTVRSASSSASRTTTAKKASANGSSSPPVGRSTKR